MQVSTSYRVPVHCTYLCFEIPFVSWDYLLTGIYNAKLQGGKDLLFFISNSHVKMHNFALFYPY